MCLLSAPVNIAAALVHVIALHADTLAD